MKRFFSRFFENTIPAMSEPITSEPVTVHNPLAVEFIDYFKKISDIKVPNSNTVIQNNYFAFFKKYALTHGRLIDDIDTPKHYGLLTRRNFLKDNCSKFLVHKLEYCFDNSSQQDYILFRFTIEDDRRLIIYISEDNIITYTLLELSFFEFVGHETSKTIEEGVLHPDNIDIFLNFFVFYHRSVEKNSSNESVPIGELFPY